MPILVPLPQDTRPLVVDSCIASVHCAHTPTTGSRFLYQNITSTGCSTPTSKLLEQLRVDTSVIDVYDNRLPVLSAPLPMDGTAVHMRGRLYSVSPSEP